jgi:uncharacterized membrane protein YphA (DoxX/SURF4 family)
MGRRFFGATVLALGVASLALHDQLISNWQLPGTAAFIDATSIAQIAGGAAMLFEKTTRFGAIVVGVTYLVFSASFVPAIVAQPGVYASWGDICYQLALLAGAMVAYGATPNETLCRSAVILFGACNISFAIEQGEFLGRTVSLVPRWIPPNGMFWAILTLIAFGLAGISLIAGYKSLLASRLLTVMLMVFAVAIWIPILIADPKTHSNWSEGIETFATAGVAWIVADYLTRRSRLVDRAASFR